jgi:hypothetical protein
MEGDSMNRLTATASALLGLIDTAADIINKADFERDPKGSLESNLSDEMAVTVSTLRIALETAEGLQISVDVRNRTARGD